MSDASPRPGALLTLSTHARNDGSAQAPATTARLYRSTNPSISDNFELVASEPLPSLAPAWRMQVSFAVYAPANPGTWSYTVCIDSVPGETETDDNCAPKWTRIEVRSPTPLWGAIAAGWQGSTCAQSFGWYFTANYSSSPTSEAAAVSGCYRLGLYGCSVRVTFKRCGALAYGESWQGCNVYGGYGDTRYTAEGDALRRCRAYYGSCEVPRPEMPPAESRRRCATTRRRPPHSAHGKGATPTRPRQAQYPKGSPEAPQRRPVPPPKPRHAPLAPPWRSPRLPDPTHGGSHPRPPLRLARGTTFRHWNIRLEEREDGLPDLP